MSSVVSQTRAPGPQPEPRNLLSGCIQDPTSVEGNVFAPPLNQRFDDDQPSHEQRRRMASFYETLAEPLELHAHETWLEWGVTDSAGFVDLVQRQRPTKAIGGACSAEDVARVRETVSPTLQRALNLSIQLGGVEKTGLLKACVDKVIAVNVIERWSSLTPFFVELKRVLRPGGRFVLTGCFLNEAQSPQSLARLFAPSHKRQADVHVIGPTLDVMKSLGFGHLCYRSVAKQVWGKDNPFALEIPRLERLQRAWHQGVVDYYHLSAQA